MDPIQQHDHARPDRAEAKLPLPGITRRSDGTFADSEKRLWLSGFLNSLTEEPKRIRAIAFVLQLVEDRVLSRVQARALLFAIGHRTSTYQELDLPFAKSRRRSSRNVSSLLLGQRRKQCCRGGVLEAIEEQFRTGLNRAPDVYQRSLSTFADEMAAHRDAFQGKSLSRTALESAGFDTRSADVLRRCIAALPDESPASEHALNPTQRDVLAKLIEQKRDGVFKSQRALAHELKIHPTVIKHVLSGQNGQPGACEKVIVHTKGVKPELGDGLKEAFDVLGMPQRKTISADQARLLLAALQSTPDKRDALSIQPKGREVLLCLIHRKLTGASTRWADVAVDCGSSVTAVSQFLNGRGAHRGVFEQVDKMLLALPPSELTAFKQSLHRGEEFWSPIRYALKLMRDPSTGANNRDTVYAMLSSLLDGLKHFPSLVIREELPSGLERRKLTKIERLTLIRAFFVKGYKNFDEVIRALPEILSLPRKVRVSEASLHRFFYGRRERRSSAPGAIELLRRAVEADENGTALRSSSISLAAQIAEADPSEAAKLLVQFFQPRSEQVLSDAVHLAENAGHPEVAAVYRRLNELPHALTDTSFACAVSREFSALPSVPIQYLEPLVVCFHRGRVSAVQFANILFSALHHGERAGVMFMLAAASDLAYRRNPRLTIWERVYVRRAYEQFLALEFPGENIRTVPRVFKADFAKLLDLKAARLKEKSERDHILAERIQSFYKAWRLEAVVKKFCARALQSRRNPYGVSFSDAVDLAHQAVLKAAQLYDPTRVSPKTGAPVRFSTVAIRYIISAVRAAAATARKEQQKVVAHLEDPRGEDARLLDLIPSHTESDRDEQLSPVVPVDVSVLSVTERRILELKYGTDRGETQTLEGIAEKLYEEGLCDKVLSGERIRQIGARALELLREQQHRGVYALWDDFWRNPSGKGTPPIATCTVDGGQIHIGESLSLAHVDLPGGTKVLIQLRRVSAYGEKRQEFTLRVGLEDGGALVGRWHIEVEDGMLKLNERIA